MKAKKVVQREPGYFESLGSTVDPRTGGRKKGGYRPAAPPPIGPVPERGRLIRIDPDAGVAPLTDAEINDPNLRILPY